MQEGDVYPLELNGQEWKRWVDRTMGRLVTFVDELDEMPTSSFDGIEAVARSLIEPLPEAPASDDVLDLLFGRPGEADGLVYRGLNPASGGYMAYVPGGGILHAAVADLIADSVNRYVGLFHGAPGLVQLEANVVRWICEMVGYPASALGFLTSGGSIANWSAILVARNECLGEDFSRGTLYCSDQTHHSVHKAAFLAGIPRRNLRVIPSDSGQRIDLAQLERQLAADRAEGLQPFLLVGNAGTTNTGAVDALPALAALAREQSLWFHVDAAYGGFFMLTERGRAVLRGIEESDSAVLDPHKGLFLPYGTGSLVVRDRQALERAFGMQASYLPTIQQDPAFVDFCEISPELSRDFRGLRVWLPVKMLGIGAFRAALEEKLDLARWAWGELQSIAGLEILAEPELSTVAFRLKPPGLDRAALNQLNHELLERVIGHRKVHLSGTEVKGDFVVRICVLGFRTHRRQVEQAIGLIRTAVRELLTRSES